MTAAGRGRVTAVCLAAAVIVSAVWLTGFDEPRVEWREKTGELAGHTAVLRRRALTVTEADGSVVWQSEGGWLVQDFYTGDLDGDGMPELLVLLWKRGSYGPARPFWVRHDPKSLSQHIFIYRWDEKAGAPRPLWMASALRPRARSVFLEADGTLRLWTEAGGETAWRWNGFGMSLIHNS